jgi:hypothetical protein
VEDRLRARLAILVAILEVIGADDGGHYSGSTKIGLHIDFMPLFSCPILRT